jgi:hypothetical protein
MRYAKEIFYMDLQDKGGKPHCVVGRITNLVCHDEFVKTNNGLEKKTFQTFEAAGYKLVTGYHYYESQLGIVIPDGFVLPDNILEDMWLKGRLAGKHGNRVKAKMMFGYPSEAVFYGDAYFHDGKLIHSPAWNPLWKEGDIVTDEIGAVYKG